LLLLLSLAVGVCVPFLAVHPRHSEDSFWDKYQRVRFGMTEKEVFALLGPPTHEWELGGGFGPHDCSWGEGQERIWVSFKVVNTRPPFKDVVVDKTFSTGAWWEKAWDDLQRFLPSFR
jgi:hypothetical protein